MCASRVRRVKQLSLNYLTPPRCVDGGLQRSGRSPRLGAVAVYRPADPGRDVRTFLRGGCRQDACLPVRRPRDSGLRDLHPFVGGGARWVAENLHATLSSAASHRKKGWSPRADSNRRPSPYQGCPLPSWGPRDQQHTSLRNREDWPFYLPNFWTTCGQKFATGLLRLSP